MLSEKNDLIYQNFIREHSAFFYQSSLLLETSQSKIAWRLFALFYELNPLFFWRIKSNPLEFIQAWKSRFFSKLGTSKTSSEKKLNLINLGKINSSKKIVSPAALIRPFARQSKVKVTQEEEEFEYRSKQTKESKEAWQEIRAYTDLCSQKYLLDLLNSLASSLYYLKFSNLAELKIFLQKSGGSIALFILRLLFRKELIRTQEIPEIRTVSLLGSCILWWYLLRKIPFLVRKNKLFIPTDHLVQFRSSEKDFIAGIQTKELKELTELELKELIFDLKVVQRNSQANYPQRIKDLIEFIVKVLYQEITATLESDWQLSCGDKKLTKQSEFITLDTAPWSIKNYSRFKRKDLRLPLSFK